MNLRRHAGLIVGVVVFGAILGPALPRLGRAFVGIEEVDYYGTLWFHWFVGLGGDPRHTELFYYPFGKDIFQHTGANLLDAWAALPLRWALGPVLGFNLYLLLGRAFDAWAFSRLARHFTDDRLAVGVGAVLFAATPYAMYQLAEGRPTQGILGLLPLFLLATWRAAERPGWRQPALAGVLLALIGWQYWYYAFFSGLVALGLVRLVRPPEVAGGRLALFARLSAVAALALLLTAPATIPLFLSAQSGGEAMPGLLDLSGWSLHAIGTPTTAEGHPIALLTWQPWLGQSGFFTGEGVVGHQQVGPLVGLLVLAWLWRPGRLDRAAGLAMLVTAAVIAVGPLLVVGHDYVVNPAYLGLVHALGFMQRLWWPARAFAWIAVLGGLAGTLALASLGRRLQLAATAALTALWLMNLHASGLAPMPTWDATIPAAWRCLATGPEGAIIELPFAWTQAHLYYQTAHGRPLLGGMLEGNPVFQPPEARALRQDNPWLADVLATTRAGDGARPWTEPDRQALRDLGYRYVVVQGDAFTLPEGSHPMARSIHDSRTRQVRQQLGALMGDPVYQDGRASIYAPWGDPAPCDTANITRDNVPSIRDADTRAASVQDLAIWPLFHGGG